MKFQGEGGTHCFPLPTPMVPSHTGIRGNEINDELAKKVHDSNLEAIPVDLESLLSEIKSIITKHCMEIWQRNYDSSNTGSFYKMFFPKVSVKNENNSVEIFRLQTSYLSIIY